MPTEVCLEGSTGGRFSAGGVGKEALFAGDLEPVPEPEPVLLVLVRLLLALFLDSDCNSNKI